MAGRKKKPTNLKLLEGSYRKDRANLKEPKPEIKIPQIPGNLDQIASVEWGRVSQQLYNSKLLSELDMSALAGYCEAYSLWYKSSLQLKKTGLIIETTNGNIIQNPLVGIVNKTRKAMLDAGSLFGMNPSSRAKVTVIESKDEEEDEFSKFG